MARWMRLACASRDVAQATAVRLGEQIAAHAHEVGDDAPVILCAIANGDAPELAELRDLSPSSPVWALVDEHPELVVIVGWYD